MKTLDLQSYILIIYYIQMESPFSSVNSTTFVLYLEPYLNTYSKNYQNIITLSGMPKGPLSAMVSKMKLPKLSIFQNNNNNNNNFWYGFENGNCKYVLLRYPIVNNNISYKNADYFLGADDIPSVFSYLLENGYKIDDKFIRYNRNAIALVSFLPIK
jgi:hypothetical protein